jgi:hypothetical protein
VDEDLSLKLDNVTCFGNVSIALFHLGGQLLCPSIVLSLLREKGYYWGGSQG